MSAADATGRPSKQPAVVSPVWTRQGARYRFGRSAGVAATPCYIRARPSDAHPSVTRRRRIRGIRRCPRLRLAPWCVPDGGSAEQGAIGRARSEASAPGSVVACGGVSDCAPRRRNASRTRTNVLSTWARSATRSTRTTTSTTRPSHEIRRHVSLPDRHRGPAAPWLAATSVRAFPDSRSGRWPMVAANPTPKGRHGHVLPTTRRAASSSKAASNPAPFRTLRPCCRTPVPRHRPSDPSRAGGDGDASGRGPLGDPPLP